MNMYGDVNLPEFKWLIITFIGVIIVIQISKKVINRVLYLKSLKKMFNHLALKDSEEVQQWTTNQYRLLTSSLRVEEDLSERYLKIKEGFELLKAKILRGEIESQNIYITIPKLNYLIELNMQNYEESLK